MALHPPSRRTPIQELKQKAKRLAGLWPDWENARTLVEQGFVGAREILDDEVCVIVIPESGEWPYEVSLYPEDEEWECDCDRNPICIHIIAGLMAATSGTEMQSDQALLERFPPRPKPVVVVVPDIVPEKVAKAKKNFPGKRRKPANAVSRPKAIKRRVPGPVAYRLFKSSYGLTVKRTVVFDDGELELHRLLVGEPDLRLVPPVECTDADLLVQDILGDAWDTGVVSDERRSDLLQALETVETLTLDGDPVVPVDELLATTVAFVENFAADRVRIQIRPEPTVDEVYDNGFALKDGRLGKLDFNSTLSNAEMRKLTLGQVFEVKQLTHLVVEVLPEMKKKIAVDVTSDRLPDVVLSEPRAVVFVKYETALRAMEVEGMVVYGDPIIAKIIRNRLVTVGELTPIREPDEEVPMASAIRRDLGLTPGVQQRFEGKAAKAFAQRLEAWEDGDVIGKGWEALLD